SDGRRIAAHARSAATARAEARAERAPDVRRKSPPARWSQPTMSASVRPTVRVVLDAMGSDRAPAPEVAGALRAARDGIEVVLVGDRARLEPEAHGELEIVHASEVVTMHDHAAQAYRGKPDSSMRVAVERVAAGGGDAVVSAGNSGAMLATAVFALGRLPGVERPAIVTVLPTPSGPLVLCDAGANVEPKASQLAQFGVLAAA